MDFKGRTDIEVIVEKANAPKVSRTIPVLPKCCWKVSGKWEKRRGESEGKIKGHWPF